MFRAVHTRDPGAQMRLKLTGVQMLSAPL